jgi:hypothetical protein
MSGPHVEIEEFGMLSDVAADDPRLRHIESCPLCGARWLDYRSFAAGEPLPAEAGGDEAHAVLEALIERETSGARVPRAPRAVRTRERLRWRVPFPTGSRWLNGGSWALAAAAVIVVSLVVVPRITVDSRRPGPAPRMDMPQGDVPQRDMLRGPSTVERGPLALEPVEAVAPGQVRLRWHPEPRADAYEIRLYLDDLTEAARIPAGAETTLTLGPGQLPRTVASGTSLMWRVTALRHGADLARSAFGTLKTP